jgi:molybdopterin converting factor subunit 1
MPHLNLLYFAGLRDLRGCREESLPLPEGVATVADLAKHLQTTYPELSGRLDQVRFAINESFADSGETVADGDVIALIPPVSGG